MEWFLSGVPQLFCGFIIGFLIAYSGVGGGALIIPSLIVFFDVPPSIAVGTASLFAVLTKIAAAAQHWKIGNINLRLCWVFTAAAAPGVLLSALLVNYFSQVSGEEFQTILRYCIVVAIALSLLAAQYKPKQKIESQTLLIIAAFIVGLVMGATGVGGGVLIVPVLFLLSTESPKGIVGASILIALVLSGITALTYSGGGQIDYTLALWMTVGAFIATPLAIYCLQKSSQIFVRRTVTGLIVAALVLMLWG